MPLFGPPNVNRLEAKRDTQGLVKALQYEKNPQVPCAPARALGRIGDAQVVEPLTPRCSSTGTETKDRLLRMPSARLVPQPSPPSMERKYA